jgi:hypothetical protein
MAAPTFGTFSNHQAVSDRVLDDFRTIFNLVDRPAASLNAVVTSLAWAAIGSGYTRCVPFTMPGENPVTAVPGLKPRSPLTVLGAVLVNAVPARIAKFAVLAGAVGGTVDQSVAKLVLFCNSVGIQCNRGILRQGSAVQRCARANRYRGIRHYGSLECGVRSHRR